MLQLFFILLQSVPTLQDTPSCLKGGYYDLSLQACIKELYVATFEEARMECNSLLGVLPPIHSIQQQVAINNTIEKSCSPIATGPNFNKNAFLGMENGAWLYGDPTISYNNWGDIPGSGNAIIQRDSDGKWYTTDERASTVCLYSPVIICRSMFFYSKGLNLCITEMANNKTTWNETESFCESNNAVTISPINNQRKEFIYSYLQQKQPKINQIWVGWRYNESFWADGTPFTRIISPPLPEEVLEGSFCLALTLGPKELWELLPCIEKLPSLCQYTPSIVG